MYSIFNIKTEINISARERGREWEWERERGRKTLKLEPRPAQLLLQSTVILYLGLVLKQKRIAQSSLGLTVFWERQCSFSLILNSERNFSSWTSLKVLTAEPPPCSIWIWPRTWNHRESRSGSSAWLRTLHSALREIWALALHCHLVLLSHILGLDPQLMSAMGMSNSARRILLCPRGNWY